MRKILASILAITMLMTTLSTCIIPASADEVTTDEDLIYFFDFENSAIDGKDWIDNIITDDKNDNYRCVTGITGVKEGAITINKAKGASENHAIQVVADLTNANNKVLKLSAGYAVPGIATKIRFNADGKTGIPRSEMGVGKKLVYETKIYLTPKFAMTSSSQLVTTDSEGQTTAHVNKGLDTTMEKLIYPAESGSWGGTMARSQSMGPFNSDGSHGGNGAYGTYGVWTEWKHVVDVSKSLSAEHSDTARVYMNDRLITSKYTSEHRETITPHGANDKYNPNGTALTVGNICIDYIPKDPGDLPLFDDSEYQSIGDTWWGSAFTINPQTNTERADTFYIDDVKAYWIDALTYTTTNTEPVTGDPIEIKFNLPIRETVNYHAVGVTIGTQSYDNFVHSANEKEIGINTGLFTIVDAETKEVVSNAVEGEVTLSADGKTVSITPNMDVLGSGGNYQIKISEYLIDEHGQGLENNSKPTYIDLKIPKEHKVITLFEEDFEDGYTVDENWLNDANATNASDAGYTSGASNYRTDDGLWDIQTNGVAADANDFVGVVNAPELLAGVGGNFSGKVLMIDETGAASYTQALCVRRNFKAKAEAISLTKESSEYKGKRLIYEADIYCAPKKTITEDWKAFVHAMKISSNIVEIETGNQHDAKNIYEYSYSGWRNRFLQNGKFGMEEGAELDPAAGPKYMWYTAITTPSRNGQKLRMVVDQSDEKDTIRMYADGKLISKTVRSVLDGHARNGMVLADLGPSDYMGQTADLGSELYGIWNSGVDSTMYIDNFKAYLVDNFEVESVAVEGNSQEFNTEEGRITYKFTKPVDRETAIANKTIVLLNGKGEVVDGGIDNVEFEDENYTMKIKLSETIPGSTNYTIWLTESLLDTDGLNISLKYKYYTDYNIGKHYTPNSAGNYEIAVNGVTTVCILMDGGNGKQAIKLVNTYTGNNSKNATYIDCYLPDYSNSINGMKTEVDIITAKSNNVSATAAGATVDTANNKVSTSVSFDNNGSSDANVWCVIAAFGEYNEMLGCFAIERTVGAGSSIESIPVNFTATKSGITSVKMFVWNSAEDMQPYQKAEDILNGNN